MIQSCDIIMKVRGGDADSGTVPDLTGQLSYSIPAIPSGFSGSCFNNHQDNKKKTFSANGNYCVVNHT